MPVRGLGRKSTRDDKVKLVTLHEINMEKSVAILLEVLARGWWLFWNFWNLAGVLFNNGLYISGGSAANYRITWLDFILPGSIPALGIDLTLIGIKLKAKLKAKNSFQRAIVY